MTDARKKTMSRDEARALYDNLRAAMEKKFGKLNIEAESQGGKRDAAAAAKDTNTARKLAEIIGSSLSKTSLSTDRRGAPAASSSSVTAPAFPEPSRKGGFRSLMAAFAFVVGAAALNAGMSSLEAAGIVVVPTVQATAPMPAPSIKALSPYDRAEKEVLTALDGRRAALEEVRLKLDERERQIQQREREFAARLTEIRELTRTLQTARDENSRKSSQQVVQLARVYSAMAPEEAANLIEQLDIAIAHDLLTKMSEQRVGQILGLMSREKALMLTRMMTGQ